MSEESPHARSARLLRRSGATLSATKAHTMPPRAQKPPPLKKPLHIFLTAEQFRYAALLSHQIPFISWSIPQLRELRGLQLPTAVMALSAFALELYLKCLIRIGRKSFGNAHDLQVLFALISPRQQSRIRKFWKETFLEEVRQDLTCAYAAQGKSGLVVDFDSVLAMSKDAFTLMRYAYEGMPPNTGWAADGILECWRKRILKCIRNGST